MHAGYKLADGGRLDVESDKDARRLRAEFLTSTGGMTVFTLTLSEARAVSSSLMGAAAEA